MERLQAQTPLYHSILRLAQSRLPVSARTGPSPEVQDAYQMLAQRRGSAG